MSRFFVVVDDVRDWAPYYPSKDVISFDDYLALPAQRERVRVINLCRSYRYLGSGYYCSLLAEARGHNVLPSVKTLSDLGRKSLSAIQWEGVDPVLRELPAGEEGQQHKLRCWFGDTLDDAYRDVGRSVFTHFPCPLLEITLEFRRRWRLEKVQAVSLRATPTVMVGDTMFVGAASYDKIKQAIEAARNGA